MKFGNETAAICGLFCGTCPSYPLECDGCLSSHVAPGCDDCGSGFRDCARVHSVTRCYECSEFPCSRLETFSKKHIVNGICHHTHVIDDLREMEQIGIEAWVAAQAQSHTCSHCGERILWYASHCEKCEK